MKKHILSVFALLLIVTVSNAQRMKVTDEPLDKVVLSVNLNGATMANLELQKELKLDEEQFKQVQLLNEKRYQQIQEADLEFKDNAIQRSKAIYSINLEIDKALSLMLQPEQLRVYLELEGRENNRFATEQEE
ncbi:hypothetical protein ACFSRY_01855 [Pontibacter locisalis]|uniref:Outer membrane protein n=1 Tax=Pontibacter locisalis TaxID=1719035 RepID=A0ABW5II54_9BACT